MRDMVTCFSEHAVRISETTCSSYAHAHTQPTLTLVPSVQTAVVSLYRTAPLSPQGKQLLITVTWSRNQLGQGGLTISFGDDDAPSSASFKLNTFSRLFRRRRGQRSLDLGPSRVDVFWDLSSARYPSGPEPADGYYVIVTVDSEPGLGLGDLAREAAAKRLKPGAPPLPKTTLVSRREHYSGSAVYSTRARFCDSGAAHEIVIRCSEDHDKPSRQPVLQVSIDERTVMKIRRLQWNFRGNQTVFVDGLLVDLMWDVHGWFFDPEAAGSAVFMFKTRGGRESRLWLEERLLGHKGQDGADHFSLMIFASKNP